MARLSAKTCDTAKPRAEGDRLIGDGDGLFLRIRPNGTKTWAIEFEFEGKRRKYTVGVFDPPGAPGESITAWLEHGRLSLAQARSIAGQWKADRRAGRDPVCEWEAKLSAKKGIADAAKRAAQFESEQPTVRNAIDLFIAKHIAGKKSAESIEYRLNRLAHILGERKIRDLTRKEVISALEKIASGRREGKSAKQLAGEVLIQAKRLWRFAESREWVPTSCIEPLARKDFDARPRKRDVVLSLAEIAELWNALADPLRCKADPVTIAALKMLILTGQRETEVCDALWDEIDLEAGIWKLPAARTKTGRAHLVHLAPQAVSVLQHQKEAAGTKPHVFPSPLREKQAVYGRSVNNALLTMFKRGVLKRVSPCHVHDLRRTLITRLPDLGFEPFIGHKIANHVLPGVLAHYNHNEYLSQRKAALEMWADRIEATANGANVIQLHRSAA